MCIAIFKPKDKTISKEILQTCYNSNKDGCGFAFIKDDTIYINKYMKFEDFYNDYKEVEETSPMLIHFRIATHGKVEVKNCHPFKLNNRMALIHNGIISGYGDKENKTDTQDFIDKVIGNISWKMWKNPSFIELVDKAIGYSKLVILDVTGEHFIVGESKGYWDDGVWYSNKSYQPKVPATKPPVVYYERYNQNQLWDMYGEESYDDWYDRVVSQKNKPADDDYSIVYKCSKCGKEVILNDGVDPACDVCKSTELKEVGVKVYDEVCYYEDVTVK